MLFKLTEAFLRKSHWNEDDFSEAAGFKVHVFNLADFPHYEELRRRGRLYTKELSERAQAIGDALREKGLLRPAGPMRADTPEGISYMSFSCVVRAEGPVKFTIKNLYEYFRRVQKYGFDRAGRSGERKLRRAIGWPPEPSKDMLVPGILNEKIEINGAYRPYSALLFVSPDEGERKHWADETGLAETLNENMPNDGLGRACSLAHEIAHFHQIRLASYSDAPRFYAELHADMAANAAFRQAGIGQETIKAMIHMRYMKMPFVKDQYFFAASLEDMEKGHQPKDFFKTVRAMDEIRIRIEQKRRGKNYKKYSSKKIQDMVGMADDHPGYEDDSCPEPFSVSETLNDYETAITLLRERNSPVHIYTALRQITEENVFTDPFAERLAHKILEGASYFNKDLIYADRPASRKRLRDAAPDLNL